MLFQHILSRYRIQGVSKLMGNTCVDNAEKLVLSPLLVEHDAVGNVDYLNNCFAFERAALHLNIPFLAAILVFLNNCENSVLNLVIFSGKKVAKTIILVVRANTTIAYLTSFMHID